MKWKRIFKIIYFYYLLSLSNMLDPIHLTSVHSSSLLYFDVLMRCDLLLFGIKFIKFQRTIWRIWRPICVICFCSKVINILFDEGLRKMLSKGWGKFEENLKEDFVGIPLGSRPQRRQKKSFSAFTGWKSRRLFRSLRSLILQLERRILYYVFLKGQSNELLRSFW